MAKVLALLNGVLVALYPLAVYFGLVHYRPRVVGLLLIALLLPGLVLKLRGVSRAALVGVIRLPITLIAMLALSAWLDDPRLVLALPVVINLTLLAGFGASLRGVPMVERFARMEDPHLGLPQIAYCRTVTKVWCVFFALNASVSAGLALFASVATWALYTGLLAYVAIGILASAEYIVRKYRFREYGQGLHDRLLARVFPPRIALADVPATDVPTRGETA